jgi:hypothetical protein
MRNRFHLSSPWSEKKNLVVTIRDPTFHMSKMQF